MPWQQHLPTHLRFRGEETNPREGSGKPRPPSPPHAQPGGQATERLRASVSKSRPGLAVALNTQRPRIPDTKLPSRLPKAASDARPWGGRKARGPRSAHGVSAPLRPPAATGRHSGTREPGAHTAAQFPKSTGGERACGEFPCALHIRAHVHIQIRNYCLFDAHVCTHAQRRSSVHSSPSARLCARSQGGDREAPRPRASPESGEV